MAHSEIGATPNISLCLSGGGFRATFFHLGLIRLLREARLLGRIDNICALSGGSILAAHLGVNWDRYTGDEAAFESAAQEIISFGQIDLRGRIVRRWLLGLPLLVFPFLSRFFDRIQMLEGYYSDLLKHKTLKSLPSSGVGPLVHILATSMTTGALCSFTRDGLFIQEADSKREFRSGLLPIGLAVAASSAFPPLFPPVKVTRKQLDVPAAKFPYEQDFLTDGGVFDNLGIRRLHNLVETGYKPALVVLSNASSTLDWDIKSTFSLVLNRTVRTTDILMKRVSDLEEESVTLRSKLSDVKFLDVSIDEIVSSDTFAQALDEDLQKKIAKTRTDLDRFSDTEIRALVHHGYEVAYSKLRPHWQNYIHQQDHLSDESGPIWDPIPHRGANVVSLLEQAKEITNSRKRRLSIWNPRDVASWVLVGALIAVLIPIWGPLYLANERLDEVNRIVDKTFISLDIPFASLRGRVGWPLYNYFGSGRNEVNFGRAVVSIPMLHRVGDVERPALGWLQGEDPAKHVLLRDIVTMERQQFFARIGDSVGPTAPGSQISVYVPGFNSSFESSAQRLATLYFDLNLEGVPLLFSWPSAESFSRYVQDVENANWSVPELTKLLVEVRQRGNVNIIAVGLGARIAVEAMGSIHSDAASDGPIFGEVILLLPDIDVKLFEVRASGLAEIARRITVYASNDSYIMQAAMSFHGYPRLGQERDRPIPGVDFINFSNGGFGWGEVQTDMYHVLSGTPARQRFGLIRLDNGLWRKSNN